MVRVRYSFGSRHTGRIENIDKQKEKLPDIVKKVVRVSDIVLEVLDARFIGEMRNLELERLVEKRGKKLIYVLNKADLVDYKKINRQFSSSFRPRVFVSCKKRFGSRELRERIKIEASRVELSNKRERVQVGVVGYPNSGKSSLINFLTGKNSAKTSKQAGFTRGMQKIRLSEGIVLLDTPGVIPAGEYSTSKRERFSQNAKVGARTYSDVKYPEEVVDYIMKDNSGVISDFYGVEFEGDVDEFIEKLGQKKGFLRKGGKVDVDRTSRFILRDWQKGDIRI